MKRHFDFDPLTGITQTFHMDAGSDTFWIEETQDLTPLIDANKAKFNEFSGPRDKWGDLAHVASIPFLLANQLMQEGKIWDQEYLRRWVNDSDNAVFRTRPGRI